MKKDAFYFPHDSNAHQDPKILSLRSLFGYEGIGLFWTFIELLRESSHYEYPYDIPMISMALGHPQPSLEGWLNGCLNIGLLVKDENTINSPALTLRMEMIDRRREILRQSGRRGYEAKSSKAQATLKPPLSLAQASKVKESKVKESIKDTPPKQRASFVRPSVEDITAYCKERGNSISPEKFFNHYEAKGWVVGRAPMKDWRAAVRTWEGDGSAKPKESVF